METKKSPNSSAFEEQPGGRPIPKHSDALLFTTEAAFLLGLSPRTLEAFRLRGGGPPFIAVTPKAVRYRRCDLDDWITARRRVSTSAPLPTDRALEAIPKRSER